MASVSVVRVGAETIFEDPLDFVLSEGSASVRGRGSE